MGYLYSSSSSTAAAVAHSGAALRRPLPLPLPLPVLRHTQCATSTARATNSSRPRPRLAAGAASPSQEDAPSRAYRMPLLNFPLAPFDSRATVFKEVVRGRIYTLEQEQSFASISTNIRCTVIVLEDGGLWVHAPVAPTEECVRFVESIGKPVKYIVLPTFAIEHKIYLGAFARKFPEAEVWVSPRQWTWPLNLPLLLLGVPRQDGVLEEGVAVPWGDEIDHKVLVCDAGVGPFVEVDFLHRPTGTLLVTDAVVCVPSRPPEVVDQFNSAALLESANDRSLDGEYADGLPEGELSDSEETRRRGWAIMALRVAFLEPITGISNTFDKLSDRLIVSPLIEILVFSKALPNVRKWCDEITSEWKFERIIPAHYDAPIKAGPRQFRQAFEFAYQGEAAGDGSEEGSPGASKAGGGGFLGRLLGTGVAAKAVGVGTSDLEAEKGNLRKINEALVKAGVASD